MLFGAFHSVGVAVGNNIHYVFKIASHKDTHKRGLKEQLQDVARIMGMLEMGAGVGVS